MISLVNPEWAVELLEFFDNNPIFQRYSYMAPMNKFNKNKDEPDGLFENLLYYVACAGVRFDYGLQQFKMINDMLQGYHVEVENHCLQYSNMDYNTVWLSQINNRFGQLTFQKKKEETYVNIIRFMIFKNINPKTFNINHVEEMSSIKGIGIGCINHLKNSLEGGSEVEYTDRNFIKGFCKLYNLDHQPTQKEIKDAISTWTNKKIGNMMCFMIKHYG